MKKNIISCLLCFLFFTSAASAGKLYRIRFGYYPDKIRAVMDFEGAFSCQTEEAQSKIVLHIQKTEAAPGISNYVELNDMIVQYLEVEKEGEGLKITIPLSEPIPYNIFYLSDPPRLAIDFNRNFTNVVSGGKVIDGVEIFKVSGGNARGIIKASVLKIDPAKAEVSPALARKNKGGILESFISLFNPWKEKDDDYHFYRARVSDIAKEQDAIAAVNGTYFAYTGKPLGTLLIDKELVSSPIYDRTALILTEDNQAFIDNIRIDSFFKTPDGLRYSITGVNQGRGKDAVIMYTRAWGESTGTTTDGIEIIVKKSDVKEFKLGNSRIPEDGYVLSISGPAAQFVNENIKIGDKIDTRIKIIPYSTSPKSILHMISGGPRLVKNGIVYVSKHEEKFKADISSGRAARTAVGLTRDNKILLVTVDGLPRKKGGRKETGSIGMTLEELSELMVNLGAVEAMNLDGGSSTAMWVNGRIVNRTVGGYEQKVSNAIIVRPRI